jgi:hypothetical protein
MSFQDLALLRGSLQCRSCARELRFSGETFRCGGCGRPGMLFDGAFVFLSEDLPERFYDPEYTSSNG